MLIILMAFGVAYTFFFTTSPFFTETESSDSCNFLLIGKYWEEGLPPYTRLFDNKGPLLLFLNRLGYMLTGTRYGLCFIEAVFLSATLYFTYQLLRKGFSRVISLFLLFFIALRFGTINYGGNSAEEYCLPFLTASFLFIEKWSEKREEGDNNIPGYYTFCWGLTFGVCWLTRVTNAVGLCVALLVISASLISRRDWHSLLRGSLLFLAGGACVIIPAYLYFVWTGTFAQMWYATIICNIEYVFHSPNDPLTPSRVLLQCFHFRDTTIIIFISLLCLVCSKDHRRTIGLWLLVSSVSLLWFISSKGFLHYGIISLPLIPISFLALKQLSACKPQQGVRYTVLLLFVIFLSGIVVSAGKIYFTGIGYRERTFNPILRKMKVITAGLPKDYKQKFIAYNCPADWYLYANICPYYPYFSFQDFSSFSPRLSSMILQSFQKGDAEWLLVRGEAMIIRPVLKEHYHAVRRYDNLTLYRRN